MPRYLIGSTEFELLKPNVATFNRYVDSRNDRQVLFVDCIAKPPAEEWSRLFASKPALKAKVINLVTRLAGNTLSSVRLADEGALVCYSIGVYVFKFQPATEAEYDTFEQEARQQPSAACQKLVKACLALPTPIDFDALCEEYPAILHEVAGLIMKEAGIDLEVIEKK